MTCKCSSSAACRRTDKKATIGRIAVVAAVVLLLSMAMAGAASADGETFTVLYAANEADDGTVPTDSNNPYASGATVTVLGNTGNLERTGYTFAGWNTAADGSGTTYLAGGTFEITLSTTLYAKWNAITYTVRFNTNGGEGTMSDQVFTYDVARNLTTNTFTKSGYTFIGWATTSEGSVEYSDGESVTNLSSTQDDVVNLYAEWTPNTYDITYMDQGNVAFSGTHATGYPTTHTYGTATTLKGATKDGYTFGGWFTASDCSGSAVTELCATDYTADITLYAKWDAITYTIVIPPALTLDSSGSATTAVYSVTMNSSAVAGDERKIYLSLTGSANYYEGESDGFKVKNVYGGNYLDYTVKKGDTDVALGDDIVSVSVSDKTGSGVPVTLSYTLSDTAAYAGTYQDTLTFEVRVGKIPGGYTEVEYIESTGKQYIDTGIVPVNNTDLILKFDVQYVSPFGSFDTAGFGVGNAKGDGWFKIDIKSATLVGIQCGSAKSETIVSTDITERHLYINDSANSYGGKEGSCWVDDLEYGMTITPVTLQHTNPITLFKVNGIDNSYAIARCYGFEAYSGTVILRDLVPCIRKSDNAVGMYDTVGNTFYENASGSGVFYPGPVVAGTSVAKPVTEITLNKTSTSISVKGTETLTATFTPTEPTYPYVTWSSSDTSVATVNGSGKVTGVAAGTVTITATAVDRSGVEATCAVTVT